MTLDANAVREDYIWTDGSEERRFTSIEAARNFADNVPKFGKIWRRQFDGEGYLIGVTHITVFGEHV